MAALPQFIPLPKAAEQLAMSEDELRRLVDSGKIDAIALPDGDVAVSEKDMTEPLRKEDLPEYKKYKHLSGKATWISKASRDYEIPTSTITRWMQSGIIERISSDGYKTLIDEADVAYCSEIYHKYGGQGRRLFNSDGTPYQAKTGPLSKRKQIVEAA